MTRRVKKHTARYPWKKWFNLTCFTIVKGRDYENKSYVMAQIIRNKARLPQWRRSVSIDISEDDGSLTVRVKKRKE